MIKDCGLSCCDRMAAFGKRHTKAVTDCTDLRTDRSRLVTEHSLCRHRLAVA